MIGNWLFALLVYILPLFIDIKFLTFAAAIFAFAEVLMHVFVFNIALRKFYNPGIITALFGLLPISLWYLSSIWKYHLYSGIDVAFALIWIILIYWLGFRSPLYKKLGTMSDRYAFTKQEVARGQKYINR
ncbi:MAG: HXXEE domain-containing protein [Faecalibacillus sp.]